jgi:D-psicose/D-tagatose/L-ribulose 3-epimerase
MKLGVNTLIWTARFEESHLALFSEIKSHGFDGVEVARFDFADFPARAIRSAADSEGLELILCSAFTGDTSFASESQASRGQALDLLRQACDAAHAIGAESVVGPFCSPVGFLPGRRRTEDEWKRCVDGLREVAPHFGQAGVRMAIEPLNRFETFFLNTACDAVALCEAVGSHSVGVLFDTFHANIEERHVGPAIESLGKHLFHVHTCENDRGAPGSGHVNWNSVFNSLNRNGYNGWCVIESFGFNIKEIAAAACIWRDIAPTPAQIAWDGAAFLRANHIPKI